MVGVVCNWVLLVVVVIVGGGGLLLHEWSNRRMVRRRLAGREQLGAEAFGREFFPEHADVAAKVREILARHIPVDLAGVRPEDDMVKDLRLLELDSMGIEEFFLDVEEEFDITLDEDDLQMIAAGKLTVENVVTVVQAKLAEGKRGAK